MLSFQQLACRRDGSVLFEDASLVVHAGQKVGVVGKNGCGKSSLFKMVLGELDSDAGSIGFPQSTRLSHVAQDTPAVERSALDYVIDGHKTFRALEAQAEATADAGGVAYANSLAALEDAGAWQIKPQAAALLHGLGFITEQHDWPVSRFSGGWRMRLNLAQATHIAHIERQRINLYRGNYTAFEALRAAQLANQQAMHERQQKQRQSMQSFVDRFRAKATKARQAQSRIKMLERMEDIAAAHVDSEFRVAFQEPDSLPNPLLTLEKVAIAYGDTPILANVTLSIQQGDRIGLLGANGAGKSTLVKALVGELDLQSGTRLASRNLVIGYFAQHQVDDLPTDSQPLTLLLKRYPELSESEGRNYLGGYGFQGDAVFQTIGTLSGGERARLALALIIRRKPNLLLMDEPTNHLDIDMRRALTHALQGFNGALIVISHDRSLLRASVDTLWLIAQKAVQPFNDDLDGYAAWLSEHRNQQKNSKSNAKGQEFAVEAEKSSSAAERKAQKQADAARRQQLKPMRRAVDQQTDVVTQLSDKIADIRTKLAVNDLYTEDRKAELTELMQDEASLAAALAEAEDELLNRMEILELAEQGSAG